MKHHNLNDISGRIFGRLIVIDKFKSKKCKNGTRIDWLCKCRCGNMKYIPAYNLVSNKTKSCGCLSKDTRKLPFGIAAFNTTFNRYLKQAINRNYKFELTKEEFLLIITRPCHYCGHSNTGRTKTRSNNGDFTYTGIDRLNNNIGYVLNNCVPCCVHCNRFKGDRIKIEMLRNAIDIVNTMKEDDYGREEGNTTGNCFKGAEVGKKHNSRPKENC